MSKEPKNNYTKTKHTGIFKYGSSGRYQARKKITGKNYRKTFTNIREAIKWKNTFNGLTCNKNKDLNTKEYSKLKHVWTRFIDLHFPALRPQTQTKMIQQYKLLVELEHFQMNEINSTLLSEWVIQKVKYFKKAQEIGTGSGIQARCSMNTELKILKQIYHWYKEQSEFFEESNDVFCPVKNIHYKLGFIKKAARKNKKIPPNDVILFVNALAPLYRDLAIIQYMCGGRIGEILGIQKDSINYRHNELLITHSAIYNSSKTFWYLSDLTKTSEDRTV
jgi:integrase